MEESKQKLIYSEFRDRCGHQVTLEISNQLTDSELESLQGSANFYKSQLVDILGYWYLSLEGNQK